MHNLSITVRYTLLIVLLALAAAVVAAAVSLASASRYMLEDAQSRSLAVLSSRKLAVERELEAVGNEVATLAAVHTTATALLQFEQAWWALPVDDPTKYLRKSYGPGSPRLTRWYPTVPPRPRPGDTYQSLLWRYGVEYSALLSTSNYENLLLITPNGDVVYAVERDGAFGTNLTTGQWSGSHLALLFDNVMAAPVPGWQYFADFEHYAPRQGKLMAFVAAPVFDADYAFRGVVVVELPHERLNRQLAAVEGMGKTSETYLVGADRLMRTDSRFTEQSTTLVTSVDNAAVDAAFDGQKGVLEIVDYRGERVISTYDYVDYLGERWAILSEMDLAEANAPLREMRNGVLFALLFVLLGAAFVAWMLSRSLSKPILSLASSMRRVAARDPDVDPGFLGRRDEIGVMAEGLRELQGVDRQRIQAERQVAEGQARLQSILDNAAEAIVVCDEQGTLTLFSRAAEQMFDRKSNDVLGRHISLLIPERDRQAYQAHIQRIVSGQSSGRVGNARELVAVRRDGTEFPISLGLSLAHVTGSNMLTAIISDITERKAQEARIEHLANHDELTGLPTLRLARERLSLAIAYAKRHESMAAVMFIDLDGFKAVNDTLGHDAGDGVLVEVGRRLSAIARNSDTVARLGGDEFLLVQSDLKTAADAEVLASRLVAAVCEPVQLGDDAGAAVATVGASVGIAIYPQDGETEEGLLKCADDAMYQVKRAGKGTFSFAGEGDSELVPAAGEISYGAAGG